MSKRAHQIEHCLRKLAGLPYKITWANVGRSGEALRQSLKDHFTHNEIVDFATELLCDLEPESTESPSDQATEDYIADLEQKIQIANDLIDLKTAVINLKCAQAIKLNQKLEIANARIQGQQHVEKTVRPLEPLGGQTLIAALTHTCKQRLFHIRELEDQLDQERKRRN